MLIFDIETKTFGKPNPEIDLLRFIGLYEYETNEYHFLTVRDTDKIIEIFKRHRVVISFNGDLYDIPILKRFGLWRFNHVHLDIYQICKARQNMLALQGESLSLSNIAKVWKLNQNKQDDFDYDILKKDKFTFDDLEYIKKYTLQDIEVTKCMFDYIFEYFKPFAMFVDAHDRANFNYMTTVPSVYAYKVLCHFAKIKEEYDYSAVGEPYKGGFVAQPTIKEAHGNIYCFDVNSMYPHNFIQGNLYSHSCKCCNEDEKWSGNEIFPLVGKYCKKKQGVIEKAIQEIYNLRQKYKKEKSPFQKALKEVINIIYGLSGNPKFKNVYNPQTAADCTMMGRNSLEFIRNEFAKNGYKLIYSDTDSVYLIDEQNDEEKLMSVKNAIVTALKENVIFPSDTFDIGIDERIKHMFFFNDNTGKLKKKNYMYVTTDNDVVIKGMSMIKSDSSRIAYIIFKKYMEQQVKTGNIKFMYSDIANYLKQELENNIKCATRKFKVEDVDTYKGNTESIQSQIAKKYGKGIHYLLPNRYKGAGKSIKYCTVEEFEEMGLNTNALIMDKFWKEMEPFVQYIPKSYKTKNNAQMEILAWTNI